MKRVVDKGQIIHKIVLMSIHNNLNYFAWLFKRCSRWSNSLLLGGIRKVDIKISIFVFSCHSRKGCLHCCPSGSITIYSYIFISFVFQAGGQTLNHSRIHFSAGFSF